MTNPFILQLSAADFDFFMKFFGCHVLLSLVSDSKVGSVTTLQIR